MAPPPVPAAFGTAIGSQGQPVRTGRDDHRAILPFFMSTAAFKACSTTHRPLHHVEGHNGR
jgi:hypothetical protein